MPPPSGSGWGRCGHQSHTRARRRSRSPASTGTAQSTRPPGSQRCCCKGQSGQSLGIKQIPVRFAQHEEGGMEIFHWSSVFVLNSWIFLRGIYKLERIKSSGNKVAFLKDGATASWLGIKQLFFGHRAQKGTTASGASYSFHGCMKLFNLPIVNCGTPLQNTGEKENQTAW